MTMFIARHYADPADMEHYWLWYCTCGDASGRGFATREDADDDAQQHNCPPEIVLSPGAFIEIDPDDYRLPSAEKLREDE